MSAVCFLALIYREKKKTAGHYLRRHTDENMVENIWISKKLSVNLWKGYTFCFFHSLPPYRSSTLYVIIEGPFEPRADYFLTRNIHRRQANRRGFKPNIYTRHVLGKTNIFMAQQMGRLSHRSDQSRGDSLPRSWVNNILFRHKSMVSSLCLHRELCSAEFIHFSESSLNYSLVSLISQPRLIFIFL